MKSLGSEIAIEVTLDCQLFDEKKDRHRIWITRSGDVMAPDHVSLEEEIVKALGGKVTNPCVYWQAVPITIKRPVKENKLKLPDIGSWEVSNNPFWNKSLGWIFLTAIIGEPTLAQLDPELALEHAKIYQKYKNEESFNIFSELEYLQSPWKRAGGYRRNTIVAASELEAMIKTGLSINRVASALSLGLTPEQAAVIVKVFEKNNLPTDLVINCAYLLSGERIKKLIPKMSDERVKSLPYLLTEFSNNSKNILDADIESYLLG